MENDIQQGEEVLLHTYNRYPVVLDRGEDVYLYDTQGKKYLDFGSGIGVYGLGYSCTPFKEAVKKQVDRLTHTSNLYYNEPAIQAATRLKEATRLSKVFFTNSGTEAIEGAIKVAKKYAYERDGRTDHEIIAMKNSFHGRSLGALSITGNEEYQKAFKPLLEGVRFADFNDIDSVKAQITEKTCGIILEPIQGEGGVCPASQKFMKELESICKEKGILLILDEIQCGMGRTGKMFAYQGYGIEPDVITTAKALGNGLPVGAFVLNEKTAKNSLKPGDHGTTYGGNPLVCAGVTAVFEEFDKKELLNHVENISSYLEGVLEALIGKYDFVKQRRGKGLMQGLVLEEVKAADVAKVALEYGLIILTAGGNVLRFLPPLIVTEKEIDEMVEKLEMSFQRIKESK